MSRATVRAAVKAYIEAGKVPGVNAVLPTQPKTLLGLEYTSGKPGESSGAICALFFERQEESPEGFDGAGGARLTVYTTAVQVFHQSHEPKAEDAMAHFDSVVDGLCAWLRSDPSLGTPKGGQIISGAYRSLVVEFGEPELDADAGGAVSTWAVIRFPIEEWNQQT